MTCARFIERLDDLLEGGLDPADRREAEEHLRCCGACRDLVDRVARAGAPVAPPPDLLGAVLARTSGPPCESARARLCDHVDRRLAPPADELVRMHLGGCGECRALAAALARSTLDLPGLAGTEPDGRFAPDVLARTSRRAAFGADWRRRLASAWPRLARRPRIAWEGAYVGTIVLALLLGTPNAPLAGVPGKALALVRTVPVSAPAGAAGREARRIGEALRSRWTDVEEGVRSAGGNLAARVTRRSAAAWERLLKNLGTAWAGLASRETKDDAGRPSGSGRGDEGER